MSLIWDGVLAWDGWYPPGERLLNRLSRMIAETVIAGEPGSDLQPSVYLIYQKSLGLKYLGKVR